MKEAFWGALIIVLGLFGIVVINIFQNVTVDNDRIYYLIKETTEASALDALDLTNYRLTGTIRMVEDKFVENLTRRFAQNVTIGDYTIIVEDINELPPKISLRVRSGITSLRGEEFGIVNRVDGIIETKYNLQEVLEFLDITEEEWIEHTKGVEEDWNSEGEKTCQVADIDEPQCLTGDIRFIGFGDVELSNAVCQDENPTSKNREAKYQVCECGTWKDKSETVSSSISNKNSYYEYTWKFKKNGTVRTIERTITSKVDIDVCTTAIEEWVPKDINNIPNIQEIIKDGKTYEPSTDNKEYMVCPQGGIRIPVGLKINLHPNYIPSNSINRDLDWSVDNETVLSIQKSNPGINCVLNNDFTKCLSKATITPKKEGTTYVNVATKRGQTASCKVEVYSGEVEEVSCNDLTLSSNGSETPIYSYSPLDAIKTKFKWSISDTNIATIDENGKVTAKNPGSATITITSASGKSGTCKVTVNSPPPVDTGTCQQTHVMEKVGEVPNTTRVEKLCTPPQYKSCKTCGYNSCYTLGCGFKSCPACGPLTCQHEACGYAECKHEACGFATCENEACGTTCLKKNWLGICTKKGNKTCQHKACGYAECKTPSCGLATCENEACGYKSCEKCGTNQCYHEDCGFAACEKCGPKICTYEPGTTTVYKYEDVVYYGKYESEQKSADCVNGKKEIIVNTYCKYSRTKYYLDPGKETRTLINTYTYDQNC